MVRRNKKREEKKTEISNQPDLPDRRDIHGEVERLLQRLDGPRPVVSPLPVEVSPPPPLSELRGRLTLDLLREALERARSPIEQGVVYREIEVANLARSRGLLHAYQVVRAWTPSLSNNMFNGHKNAATNLEKLYLERYARAVLAIVEGQQFPPLPSAHELRMKRSVTRGSEPEKIEERLQAFDLPGARADLLRVVDDIDRYGGVATKDLLVAVDRIIEGLHALPATLQSVIDASPSRGHELVRPRAEAILRAFNRLTPILEKVHAGEELEAGDLRVHQGVEKKA